MAHENNNDTGNGNKVQSDTSNKNGPILTFYGVQGSIPAPDKPEDVETKIASAILEVERRGGLSAVLEGREATIQNIRDHYLFNLPAASKTTYGRESSCAQVRTSDGKLIILDAGTGLRKLGEKLMREMPLDATILISHTHWDHIQGFPFFTPAYIPGNKFTFYGVTKDDLANPGANGSSESLKACFETQMGKYFFPVKFADLASATSFHKGYLGEIKVGNARITATFLNHPDPNLGYRIEDAGKVIVYATDHEHWIPEEKIDISKWPAFRTEAHANLERLARGADVLIYDGQYTPEEYNPAAFGLKGMPKIGWGHSTYKHGIDLALRAGAKKLVLTHHDPTHNDSRLDQIKYTARAYLAEQLASKMLSPESLSVVLSYEGMVIQP